MVHFPFSAFSKSPLPPPALSRLVAALLAASLGGCAIDARQVSPLIEASDQDAGPGVAEPISTGGSRSGTSFPPSDDIETAACSSEDCNDRLRLQPAEEAANTSTTCPPDNVCQTFGSDCSASWRPNTRDGAACQCDESGCLLLPGEPCTGPELCQSGDCRATSSGDNICCSSGCEQGSECSADGASCQAAASCIDGARRCSGSTDQRCAEGQWVAVAECGTLGCDTQLGGCLRSAGQACNAAGECGEGQCQLNATGASVCCTADCSNPCQRCDATGTSCEALADDDRCPAIECPPEDTCRTYVLDASGQSCSNGACRTAEEACTAVPRNANQQCDPSTLCDDEGRCARPKRAQGAQCNSGTECLSGACVASSGQGSICCNRECAANEQCGAGGNCQLAPVCSDGQTQCSGSAFQRCVDGQWTTLLECGQRGCSETREGCLGGLGDSCADNTDCGIGQCQDSPAGAICCSAPCDGACRQCAATGQSCVNLADDDACGVIDCPSDTTCSNFPPDVRSQRCIAGRCGSVAALCPASPRAQGQVCSSTNLCDNAGNCSQPKRSVGESCFASEECSSNFCVDGVCCNEDCNGTCETCAGTGVCRAPFDDNACPAVRCGEMDPGCAETTSDILTNRCESKGRCKSESACGLAPEGTQCQSGFCDLSGSCQAPQVSCGAPCDSTGVGTTGLVCCSLLETREVLCTDQRSCLVPNDTVALCDDNGDCSQGDVCCLFTTPNSRGISCRPADECAARPGVRASFYQICGAPGAPSSACPSGQQCVLNPNTFFFGDWSVCLAMN